MHDERAGASRSCKLAALLVQGALPADEPLPSRSRFSTRLLLHRSLLSPRAGRSNAWRLCSRRAKGNRAGRKRPTASGKVAGGGGGGKARSLPKADRLLKHCQLDAPPTTSFFA